MNLREAAQQALDALEQCGLNDERRSYEQERAAITALRAALYEDAIQRFTDVQQQMDRSADTGKTSDHIPDATKMVATINEIETVEPVAWATVGFVTWGNRQIEKVDKLTREAQPEYGFVIPLYTAPPKREPLTDAEIKRLYDSLPSKYTLAMFARAVERAHGIGGEK